MNKPARSLALLLAALLAPAALTAADLKTGLCAWWSFNEPGGRGLYDQSGGSNHGRLSGPVTREPGRTGGALHFAPGRYAGAALSEPILKPGTESLSFTLAAWVKADGPQGGREKMILGKTGFHAGLLAHSEKGENRYGFAVWSTARSFSVDSPALADFDAWHHLAAVWEARRVTLYLDGQAVKTATFEGEIRDYPDGISIGGLARGSSFSGLIDEARVYRRALSADEIVALRDASEIAVPGIVPGEEPLPVVRLEKDRPELGRPVFAGKPVIAHYMTQMNTLGSDQKYFMNPAYGRPDGPASNVGGAVHYDAFFAHTLAGKGDAEIIETEVRAAKRLGIDGFHFYYQAPEPGPAPGEGNNRVIRLFFKVLAEKKIDFKLTLCISHPNQAIEASEKIRATAQAIKPLLVEFRDSPHWLRAPDGRIVFFTWSTEGFSDGARSHGELFLKPDVAGEVKALAEGYETLRRLLDVPAAFVFHVWDMDSMYMSARSQRGIDLTNQYAAYLDAVLSYFPAVTGFADYPANEKTTREWAEWGRECKKRGRAYGQAVMTDYVKTYKKNGKLPTAADFPGLQLKDTKSLYLVLPGAVPYRTLWQRAVDFDAAFVSYVTWNDYPEGHHLAPEAHHPFAFALLSAHYEKVWRKQDATPDRDIAMAFFHKYPVDAKPILFPMRAEPVPWHAGREPVDPRSVDIIDAVALLKAPGELWVNGKKRLNAPVGLSSVQIPMENGPVCVEIHRGGAVAKSLVTPEWITDKPYRTDRLIYAYSTECEALTRELFGNQAVPDGVDYAQDSAGVPLWKRRYRLPESSVEDAQEPMTALSRMAVKATVEEGSAFLGLAPNLVRDSKAFFQELPVGSVKEPWQGPSDLSGKLWILSDANALHLRLEVRDDRHVDPPADPGQCWRADSLQVGVSRRDGASNLECGVALRGAESVFAQWQGSPASGDRIQRSARMEGGVLVYALRIPLDLFGLKPGDPVRISAIVNDADRADRKGFMEFGSGIGLAKDPQSYGLYQLAR